VNEPARWGRKRALLDLMDKLHLARPATRAYELGVSARSQLAERHGIPRDDGLPLPPARLRAQVGPLHADADFFLRSGRQHADLIEGLLRDVGTPVSDLDALLDWGCGCGRVLRHWPRRTEADVAGCDIDERMVAWCLENLPFADVRVTGLNPPLPYADSSFGLVYAFSVFTHLSEELQHAWMGESRRVLEPGGHLLLSTLGNRYASLDRLTVEERDRFARGELVVLYERSAGTSLCSAYHPPRYVHDQLAQGFGVVAFRPAGDEGGHDIHLLRKQ
jgi:SAM-dependent methyltransferase